MIARFPSPPRRGALLVALFGALLLGGIIPAGSTRAQTILGRSVISGGGGTVSDSAHIIRGTLSQTAAGRAVRGSGGNRHDIGFWYWAYRPDFVARVSLPRLQAEVGTHITVPLHLTVSGGNRPFGPRPFHARIRYNHTLLRSVGKDPICSGVNHDCVLELNGVADGEDVTLATLEFVVALGDSESTPLTIEEFEWTKREDERIATVREDGNLELLGVCRTGGELRLIRAGAFASRLRVWPNPVAEHATLEFVAAETGPVVVRVVDMLGNEVARLVDAEAEAERLYSSDIDLKQIPSGSYVVVFTTPTGVVTQRLMITQ